MDDIDLKIKELEEKAGIGQLSKEDARLLLVLLKETLATLNSKIRSL